MMEKKKILAIVGPTSSGKSDLAVVLAEEFGGEVISADSRQVYKGLDVGSGKITGEEMRGVPHHLLDVADPRKKFSAAEYKKLAEAAIEDISKRGKAPIIAGGTGFYIDALALDLPDVPPDEKLREELGGKSIEELQEILGEHKIKDPGNKVRLIRAIEIVRALGKIPKISKNSKYDFVWVGLSPDNLDEKIAERLDRRLEKIIEEAEKLHSEGLSYERMHELGLEYRYAALYLQNKLALPEMRERLLAAIRQYAKRQMTWFKRNKNIKWFKPGGNEEIKSYLRQVYRK